MPSNELSSRKQQAVLLEATGLSREEIVALGIASTATISRWRREPEYQTAVTELSDKLTGSLEPLFQKLRVELAAGAHKSIETLMNAQEAMKDDDGAQVPDWPIRVKAAAELLNKLKEAGLVTSSSSGDEAGPTQAAAAAVIIIKDDDVQSDVIEGTTSP